MLGPHVLQLFCVGHWEIRGDLQESPQLHNLLERGVGTLEVGLEDVSNLWHESEEPSFVEAGEVQVIRVVEVIALVVIYQKIKIDHEIVSFRFVGLLFGGLLFDGLRPSFSLEGLQHLSQAMT